MYVQRAPLSRGPQRPEVTISHASWAEPACMWKKRTKQRRSADEHSPPYVEYRRGRGDDSRGMLHCQYRVIQSCISCLSKCHPSDPDWTVQVLYRNIISNDHSLSQYFTVAQLSRLECKFVDCRNSFLLLLVPHLAQLLVRQSLGDLTWLE